MNVESDLRFAPGDIALVTGAGWASTLIVWAQRALRGHANYSHCAIYITRGLWCHAVPKGVELITSQELFTGNRYLSNWKVFRHPRALVSTNSAGLSDQWLDAILFFAGQKYNYRIGKVKQRVDVDSFCSELIVKAYGRMGVPFAAESSTAVLPADIERQCKHQRWLDITKIAKQVLADQGVQSEQDLQVFKLNYLHFRRKYLENKVENARCAHFVLRHQLTLWNVLESEADASDRERVRAMAKQRVADTKAAANELLALYWDAGSWVDGRLHQLELQMSNDEFSEEDLNRLHEEAKRWWM